MQKKKQKNSHISNLKKKYPKLFDRINNILPYVFLTFCALAYFYPAIFQDKIPLPTDALVGAHIPWTEYRWPEYPAGVPIKSQEITDAVSQFYPWRSLVGEFWRNGKAPLWNFYMFNGTPFLATLHSASLYPLNFIYLFLSDASAWTALVFLQLILSVIFMYIFLKELQLDTLPSILGSLAFGFCGYMVAWMQFATGGHAGSWLPVILYFVLKFHRSQNINFLFPIPFLFFMVFTAGDFQVPLYISLTYFLFGAYLFWKSKDFISGTIKTGVFFLFGVLLSMPQFLPTYELFKNSVRFDDSYINQYFFGLMHWEKISLFLWPDFFGNIVTRNYWGKYGFHEYMSYVGIVGIVFVVFSLLNRKEKYERFFWLLLSISLVMLFPTPVAFLPYKLNIPALGTSSASRIIFLVDFSLSVLMAYGLSKYASLKRSLSKIIFYLLVVTAGLGAGLFISYLIVNDPTTPATTWVQNTKVSLRNMIPGTAILIFVGIVDFILVKRSFGIFKKGFIRKIGLTLIVLVFFADMFRFAHKNRPFSEKKFLYPEVPIIEYLTDQPGEFRIGGGLATNYPMVFKLESVEGYDPIYPKVNSDFYSIVDWGNVDSHSGRYGLIHDFSSRMLDYAGMKYVMDYLKDQWRQINDEGKYYPGVLEPKFEEVYYDRRVYIFENTKALPYVWLSSNYITESNPQKTAELILDSDEPIVVLETDPGIGTRNTEIFEYKVRDIKKDFNRISFTVDSSEDSLAFVSETNYPGWRAYIDGQSVEIYKANYLFNAIPITKGDHGVVLEYKPLSFRLGTAIAVFAFLLISGVFVFLRRKTVKNNISLKTGKSI